VVSWRACLLFCWYPVCAKWQKLLQRILRWGEKLKFASAAFCISPQESSRHFFPTAHRKLGESSISRGKKDKARFPLKLPANNYCLPLLLVAHQHGAFIIAIHTTFEGACVELSSCGACTIHLAPVCSLWHAQSGSQTNTLSTHTHTHTHTELITWSQI